MNTGVLSKGTRIWFKGRNVREGVNVEKVMSGAVRVDAVLRGVTCPVAMVKQVAARRVRLP